MTASLIIVFKGERGVVNRFFLTVRIYIEQTLKKKGRQGCRIIVKIKKTGYMIRKLISSNNILNLPIQGHYPSVECRELYSIFCNNV